jgi:hypothetical protein
MAFNTKKIGTFQGSSNVLGGGGRFKQMVASGKSPALASFISRKVYGKARTQQMAANGKKRVQKQVSNSNNVQNMPPKGIAVGNPNALKTS